MKCGRSPKGATTCRPGCQARAAALVLSPRSGGVRAMGIRHARGGHAGQQNLRAAVPGRNSKGAAEQRKKGRTVAGRTGWIAFQKGARLRECFVGDESDNGAQLSIDGVANFIFQRILCGAAVAGWHGGLVIRLALNLYPNQLRSDDARRRLKNDAGETRRRLIPIRQCSRSAGTQSASFTALG